MSAPSAPREEAIPILRVKDATATAGWYERLGFQLVNVHRFAPGLPAFATIQRGDISLFLSEHTGDARPDTLVYLRVRDAEQLAASLGVTTEDNPWGRDFEICRPGWQRLRIGTPSWW
jgi:Glyoxalase superfamily protein